MYPVIINRPHHPINVNAIFGEETDKVLDICERLFDRHMYPLLNAHPCSTDYMGDSRNIREWLKTDGYFAYREAVQAWEKEDAKLLRALYGIAKRHHVRVEWLRYSTAASFPDQFMVYKNGTGIAMIQC